jgi:hypothetical protein
MTDPDRKPEEPSRNDVSLWILVGLMVLIAVGGLVYGLSYPSFNREQSAADGRLRSEPCPLRASALEHDPEKCEAVFGKDHAPIKSS